MAATARRSRHVGPGAVRAAAAILLLVGGHRLVPLRLHLHLAPERGEGGPRVLLGRVQRAQAQQQLARLEGTPPVDLLDPVIQEEQLARARAGFFGGGAGGPTNGRS